jgi:Na+/pantothenate symporter
MKCMHSAVCINGMLVGISEYSVFEAQSFGYAGVASAEPTVSDEVVPCLMMYRPNGIIPHKLFKRTSIRLRPA